MFNSTGTVFTQYKIVSKFKLEVIIYPYMYFLWYSGFGAVGFLECKIHGMAQKSVGTHCCITSQTKRACLASYSIWIHCVIQLLESALLVIEYSRRKERKHCDKTLPLRPELNCPREERKTWKGKKEKCCHGDKTLWTCWDLAVAPIEAIKTKASWLSRH